MFCPRCGAEYREGFTECAECGVPLAHEPPPPPAGPEYVDYVPVLATFNAGDIAIIKAVLAGEEIKYFFEGECFNIVRPLVQPARLLVRWDQVQDAESALKGLKLTHFALSNIGNNTATFVLGALVGLNALVELSILIRGLAGITRSRDLASSLLSAVWWTAWLALSLVIAFGLFAAAFKKSETPAEE